MQGVRGIRCEMLSVAQDDSHDVVRNPVLPIERQDAYSDDVNSDSDDVNKVGAKRRWQFE